MKLLRTIVVASFAVFLSMCGEGGDESCTPPPDATKVIEITYPKGGETFKVGQTISISFKVDASKVSQIVPMISIDGGETSPKNIPPTGGVQVKEGSGFVCMEYSWTIGQLPANLVYSDVNPNCIIRIEKYGQGSVADESGVFTITK